MRVTHATTTAPIGEAEWIEDHVIEGAVATDDPRLTDARTPTAHSHDYADPGHTHDTSHSHTAAEVGAADDEHDHDAAYAPVHAHPYAADDHSHDTTHDHDADYSALGHTHDYAASGHTHSATEAFPVGSVFLAVVNTNPGTLLGYGTWAAFGAGKMLVGRDPNDTDFDTAEETGGAKTHTHAAHSSPLNHTHTVSVTDPGHVHTMQRFPTATGGSTGFTVDTSMSGTPAAANDTASKTTGITASTANPAGGVASLTHDSPSHLPPYIVVYAWKRTA